MYQIIAYFAFQELLGVLVTIGVFTIGLTIYIIPLNLATSLSRILVIKL